jgi:hypothetical protein
MNGRWTPDGKDDVRARLGREGVDKRMTRRMTSLMAVAALAAPFYLSTPARAELEHERGKIVSIDWDQLTMEFKDQKDRLATRKFSRNATVKFTDGARFYPRPSTKDLRPPMYVYYIVDNGVIQSFEVRELGFTPGNEQSTSGRKEPGVPRTVTGRLTAFDANVRQVELEIDGVRETFQLTDAPSMRGLAAGQRVQLRTEWSGQQELTYELRILGR